MNTDKYGAARRVRGDRRRGPTELAIFAIANPPVSGAESPAYGEAKIAFDENASWNSHRTTPIWVGKQAAKALAAA